MHAQSFTPQISARVDTTNSEVKKVYNLFVNYLNSEPEKGYENPYWNEVDYEKNLRGKGSKLDRSAYFLYMGMNSKQLFSIFNPFVLQIDSIAQQRYLIKTLYEANEPQRDVIGITKHYAVRQKDGQFKLENTINYDTRNWKVYKIDFISYFVAPSLKFDRNEAEKAVQFCRETADKLGLKIKPFKYYACANQDQAAGLYNFDYWVFGIRGLANSVIREVFSSYANFYFPHEFVHLLLPRRTNGHAPNIINEGIATWLGGPSPNLSYEQALAEVKIALKQYKSVSIDKIISQEIRNPADSNILYVTGAVICQSAFNLKGKEAVMKLYNSSNSTLKETMEEVFEMPFEEIEKMIFEKLEIEK